VSECDRLRVRLRSALYREQEARNILTAAHRQGVKPESMREIREGLKDIKKELTTLERSYAEQCRMLTASESARISRLEGLRSSASERLRLRRQRNPIQVGVPFLSQEEYEMGERSRRVGERERRP
jgi:hypothetical protein